MTRLFRFLTFFSLLVVALIAIYFYPRYLKSRETKLPAKTKPVKIGILSQKSNKTYETSIISMKRSLEQRGYQVTYLQDEIKDTNEFENSAKRYLAEAVDVIVTNSTPATKAALAATKVTPIVFGSVGDPVLNGVVKSLDSSENNSTGVSSLSVKLTPNRIEILKNSFKFLKNLYFIYQPGEVASENSRLLASKTSRELNLKLIEKEATNSSEVKKIALALKSREADAIVMSASGMVWANAASLIEAQQREKIPLIGVDRTMAEAGAVFSYGPDYRIAGQQLAGLVDQVLQGIKPQYLPIQRPKKIELIINRSAAARINLVIPAEIISKADEVL